MLSHTNETLLQNALLKSMNKLHSHLVGKRIWLALSGGRDSLVMASVCLQLYTKGHLPFCPQFIHVNHGIQTANDAWANQVSQWASDNGSQCVVIKAYVNGTDEQTARHARYAAIAQHINCHDIIMTAHHANDQSETLLMRLFAGTGVKGLSGMTSWSCHDIPININHPNQHNHSNQHSHSNQHQLPTSSIKPLTKPIYLWRPWLNISRDAINEHAHRHALPYINDPTNLTGTNVRSWLRRELLPIIEQRYPQVIGNIIRLSDLMSDADAILQDVYHNDKEMMVNDCCVYPATQPPCPNRYLAVDDLTTHRLITHRLTVDSQLELKKFGKLSGARQRSFLYHWLSEKDTLTPNKQRIDDILALAYRDDNDHQTQLPWQGATQHYVIRRYRHTLHRLDARWLNWLQAPINDKVFNEKMFICVSATDCTHVHAHTVHAHTKQTHTITLRKKPLNNKETLTWQLVLDLTAFTHQSGFTHQNIDKHIMQGDFYLCVRPLYKTDRLSIYQPSDTNIGKFTPPKFTPLQSGKKLQQSLGIASWLRQSVLLVEAQNVTDCHGNRQTNAKTLPLWLICPWRQWALQSFLPKKGIKQTFILS